MHNSPDRLLLLGSGSEQFRSSWRNAYKIWSMGLWARDPVLAREGDQRLVAATETWLTSLQLPRGDAPAVVRGKWDRYLGIVTASRGMRHIGLRQRYRADQVVQGLDREHVPSSREPEVIMVDSVDRESFAANTPQRFRIPRNGQGVTIHSDAESVELRTFWRPEAALTQELAAQIMAALVHTAIEVVSGIAEVQGVAVREIERVEVRCGDSRYSFGWRVRGLGDFTVIIAGRLEAGRLHLGGTTWTIALGLGDPRTALGVYQDGRAYLRFPRSLLEPGGWVRIGDSP